MAAAKLVLYKLCAGISSERCGGCGFRKSINPLHFHSWPIYEAKINTIPIPTPTPIPH
jgi:hypothetical protein